VRQREREHVEIAGDSGGDSPRELPADFKEPTMPKRKKQKAQPKAEKPKPEEAEPPVVAKKATPSKPRAPLPDVRSRLSQKLGLKKSLVRR
jgi:hypothetical protein